MSKGHWYRPLVQAMKDAGCEFVRRNHAHEVWRSTYPDRPLIVINPKLNNGKLAHRLAKQAGADLK